MADPDPSAYRPVAFWRENPDGSRQNRGEKEDPSPSLESSESVDPSQDSIKAKEEEDAGNRDQCHPRSVYCQGEDN